MGTYDDPAGGQRQERRLHLRDRARWEIEMLFDVLKNACRVEALALGSITQLERALALFMVVAWRIARLMRLGRTCPALDAELFFDQDEIQAAYLLRKKTPPDKPRLNDVLRQLACIGGSLAGVTVLDAGERKKAAKRRLFI